MPHKGARGSPVTDVRKPTIPFINSAAATDVPAGTVEAVPFIRMVTVSGIRKRGYKNHRGPSLNISYGRDVHETPVPRYLLLIDCKHPAASLTGNWVVAQDMHDGTFRRTYLDLKQDGSQITGHIRVTQFYYTDPKSSGGRTPSPSPQP